MFCLLVAYLTLFHQLGLLPFFGSDEPRYAQIAKEMSQSGDFITPTLEGRPWLEKPPLLFWMLVASFTSLGPSEWSARLPNALLALILALGMAIFAGTFKGIRCGFITFLLLTTSLLYVGYARAASTDLPLTMAFGLSLLAGFLTLRRKSYLWALVSGIAAGLTVLAKGFVALPLILLVLSLFLIITGRRFPFGPALVASVAAISVAMPWLWLAWVRNGENFLITFVVNQHLARIATDLHHHSQPFWYYIPVLLGGFFPWVLFLPASAQSLWKRGRGIRTTEWESELFLWLWAVVPFVFFSISTGKLAGYILPILPSIAVLVAIEWDRSIEQNELTSLMRRGLYLFPLTALVLSGGAVIGFSTVFKEPLVGMVLAAVPMGAVLVVRWATLRENVPAALLTLVGFTTLGLALLHTEAAPVVGRFQSTRDLCLEALPHVSPQEPLVFYRFHHFTAYYYAHGVIKGSPFHDPAALSEYTTLKPQKSYFIMTATEGWGELGQLNETSLLKQAGNFYLIELKNSPHMRKGLRELDRRYRRSLLLKR